MFSRLLLTAPCFPRFKLSLLLAACLGLGFLTLACSQSGERCVVGGLSVADQASRPGFPCQICDLSKSKSEWTEFSNAESCGEGLACFEGECLPQCRDGDVVVNPGEHHPEAWCRVCGAVDGKPAFVNLEMGTVCGQTRHCIEGYCVDSCLIDGRFLDVESRNPVNPCFQCIPERSTSEWVMGGDGVYVCQEEGEFCLEGSCTPGCFIDGDVIPLGSPHPSEPCLHCPSSGARFWTPRANRSPCGDGGQMECRKGECLPKSLDIVMHPISGAGELLAVAMGGESLRISDGSGVWHWVGDDGMIFEAEPVEGSGRFIALGHWPSPYVQALALDEDGWLWSDNGGKWRRRDLQLSGARALSAHESAAGWHLFLVGDGGSAWSWREGSEPVAMSVPLNEDLKDVFARSSSDVWAVGARGAVLHFDGTAWSALDTGHVAELRAVWAGEVDGGESGSTRQVVAAGEGGVVLRSEDGGLSWTRELPEEAEGSDILALAEAGGELYAVGSKGLFVASSNYGKTWRHQLTGLGRRESETLNALWVGPAPRLLSSEKPAGILVVAVGGDSQGGLVLRSE